MTEHSIRRATDADLQAVFRLRWLTAEEFGREPQDETGFVERSVRWAREHAATHVPHVAVTPQGEIVGAAWLALTPRVPTPHGGDERRSGDLQACYVLPALRDRGIGGRLVGAVLDTAAELGVEHVTVHASAESARMYARSGFRTSGRLLWADVALVE